MLFINKAYAQAVDSLSELEGNIPPLPAEESAGSLLMSNLMVLGVIMFLFYLLLIRPQQKRIQEHTAMLKELKKGDKVITGGGLIGKVDRVIADKDEIVIDLGDMKVTALRSTIHRKDDPRLREAPANDKGDQKAKVEEAKKEAASKASAVKKDAEPAAEKKPAAKKAAAKKTTATKKAPAKKTAGTKTAAEKK